jgi:hypothetical protein
MPDTSQDETVDCVVCPHCGYRSTRLDHFRPGLNVCPHVVCRKSFELVMTQVTHCQATRVTRD